MKKAFPIFALFIVVGVLIAQTPPMPPGAGASVLVAWDPNPPADKVTAYRVHYSTNVAAPLPWQLIGSTSSNVFEFAVDSSNTNLADGFAPGVHAFYVTASNFWSESLSSLIVSTPPVAGAVLNSTITRNTP